ncbi:hypothetical protein AVEN_257725-1 [Araneus ventricosus]|uniref:Uncharacterized protein n=1 Tax=Araneus ventricosus TaxID=182803 RepID=A0A4Y2LGT7_ARAVE|nr:hypothetical protein AVEN_257725-1 [Araneus ventricosus]
MFDGKDANAHEIPNLLKNICQVYCVHNKNKVVTYKKLPENNIFVDDVDNFLKFFKHIVKRETQGYFQELDELTVELMRDPSFRCSLIGFFFSQGLWDAAQCCPRPFYIRNGKVVRNVNFIGFYGVESLLRTKS